ncbi:protein of unknown function [Hyphomicrobium sp. 1Nfss2.1]
MDDLGIARARLRADARVPLQDDDLLAFGGQSAGDGETDDPGSDNNGFNVAHAASGRSAS